MRRPGGLGAGRPIARSTARSAPAAGDLGGCGGVLVRGSRVVGALACRGRGGGGAGAGTAVLGASVGGLGSVWPGGAVPRYAPPCAGLRADRGAGAAFRYRHFPVRPGSDQLCGVVRECLVAGHSCHHRAGLCRAGLGGDLSQRCPVAPGRGDLDPRCPAAGGGALCVDRAGAGAGAGDCPPAGRGDRSRTADPAVAPSAAGGGPGDHRVPRNSGAARGAGDGPPVREVLGGGHDDGHGAMPRPC